MRRPPGVVALPADFRAFHQLAEEAVDHAFEQLAVSWPTVLAQPTPEAYAWKVVKNRIIDLARRRNRRPVVVDVAAFETYDLRNAVDPIGELETSLLVYEAINDLPDRQRDVIILRYSLGYAATTARILGISPAGVRSTVRHARRRLRQVLGLYEQEGSRDGHRTD
ncbi:sigma-70 family RNA polymerase sigma factor [Streptomyces endocoffeicus]|uniref:sigma-70 family RNA polymerase sigma factor n=1 Tax=Streptomyces endocoffeicus TaxID=2898945 RepID=UPI001E558746|nr:sigma-70 family RNA polymerase sigma factor [Streptomyces endocoffeicus]